MENNIEDDVMIMPYSLIFLTILIVILISINGCNPKAFA